jgi:aerobic carbon-monoxide dehydrogenase small subunit
MQKKLIELKINGDNYEVAIDPRRTLVEVLREDLDLTGTKESCGDGDCGACTVLMDGKPVNGCLVLALEAQGKDIITIEGIARNGQLHPVQQAFIDHFAIQCGFCTPGMIISAVSLLKRNTHPTEDEVRKAIAGNLCRCTGYVKIVEAILATAS